MSWVAKMLGPMSTKRTVCNPRFVASHYGTDAYVKNEKTEFPLLLTVELTARVLRAMSSRGLRRSGGLL